MRNLLKITATLTLAFIFTAGMAFGQSNTANVNQAGQSHSAVASQVGQTNMATIDQDGGTNNLADVSQDGTSNQATILQPHQQGQSAGVAPSNSEAYQDQDGEDHVAYIQQANSNGDWAKQRQLGNNSEAVIRQAANGPTGAMAKQRQYGEGHWASIRTTNSPNAVVEQLQRNHDQSAEAYQVHSDDGVIRSVQEGWRNDVYTQQRSARGGSQIETTQLGEDNVGTVLQGKGWSGGASSNSLSAFLTQDGSNNLAEIMQSGSSQVAQVTQLGQGHQATVTQQ